MQVKDVKFLKLGITNRCNSRCLTCWHSNATKVPRIFDMDKQIYNHVKEQLFPHIKILDFLSGGEFFMCQYVNEVIDDVCNGAFKTTIESNMSLITPAQKQKLSKANVRFIASLDGSTKQLQEFLRPQCTYEKVIENIKYFVNCGKRVTIRMTVSNHNFYDMKNMMKLAELLKVENVIFHEVEELSSIERPLHFLPPPVDVAYLNDIIKTKWAIGIDIYLSYYRRSSMYFKPTRGIYNVMDPMTAMGAGFKVKFANVWAMIAKTDTCPIPNNFINIDIDGKIYFCSCPECRSIGVGLHKYTLQQILDHPVYDKTRKECSCKISRRFLKCD